MIYLYLIDFNGCLLDVDSAWGIEWANTIAGETNTQPCPEGSQGR